MLIKVQELGMDMNTSEINKQQDLKQFMRILDLEMVTLINILNAKGVIYTHYKLKKERESYVRRQMANQLLRD